jgi:hypothetical protein
MNKKLSIYELAERLGYEVWEKDDLKRIYVNEGYNTRKMSTTTFIWQDENGEFKVSCYIDCPSQHWNWIKSQKGKMVSNVNEMIRHAIADTFYMPVRKTDGMVFDKGIITSREKFLLYPDVYLNEEDAIKDLQEHDEVPEGYDIIAISREDAEEESGSAQHKEKNDIPFNN